MNENRDVTSFLVSRLNQALLFKLIHILTNQVRWSNSRTRFLAILTGDNIITLTSCKATTLTVIGVVHISPFSLFQTSIFMPKNQKEISLSNGTHLTPFITAPAGVVPSSFCGFHPNFPIYHHPKEFQIFYQLYARVHSIRDYGHPGNLIPPTLTPAKHPLTMDRIPGCTSGTSGWGSDVGCHIHSRRSVIVIYVCQVF